MPLPNLISSYTAPQMLAGGIMGGANAVAGALNQYEQDRQNAAYGDITFDWLAKNVQGAVSPEALQRYHKAGAKERAAMALGAQWNALKGLGAQAQAFQFQQAQQGALVPYKVDGQTYNIHPSQAAQLQAQQANLVPTQVPGGQPLNLTPGQAAQARLEQERIKTAKQPRGLTPYQQFEVRQAQQKALDEKIKASPEFKFQQDYKLPPRQVLSSDILDPQRQQYRLFDTTSGTTTEIQPEYDQYGISRRPSWLKSNAATYWTPASDIFRETKFDRNVQGVKTTQYAPNPEGELVNIGGQRIPYSEIQGIKNRHDQLLQQAQAALKAGKDPQVLAQWWDRLGYDPRELLQ